MFQCGRKEASVAAKDFFGNLNSGRGKSRTRILKPQVVAGDAVGHANEQLISNDGGRRAAQGTYLGFSQFTKVVGVRLHHVEEGTLDLIGENLAVGKDGRGDVVLGNLLVQDLSRL